MHNMKEWPRFLLTLPKPGRFVLLILCFILCVGIHILSYPASHNGSLLVIPLVLAAWLFGKRGLYVSIVAEIAVMVVYQSIRLNTLRWPLSFILFFWGGFLILLFIGYTVALVRGMLDSAEAARRTAEQAEQETAIAYDKQHELTQLKDHFLAHVSHELRTPLTVLGMSLELLTLQHGRPDQEMQLDLVAKAIESHGHLVDVMNHILQASAIVQKLPPLHYEAIALRPFVQEVLGEQDSTKLQTYTIELRIGAQVMVWADPQSLRQVMVHLLSNVFKYVPQHTHVTIEALQPTPASPVCLSVQDEGPGIPADEQSLLFEKYTRLERDHAGSTLGMGLGLFICKHLVQTMGGRIWVESSGRPGEGCRFNLTLLPFLSSPTLLSSQPHKATQHLWPDEPTDWQALQKTSPRPANSEQEEAVSRVPAEFYFRILHGLANEAPSLRLCSVIQLIEEQIFSQFDPSRRGLVLLLVRCLPPSVPSGVVRSLRAEVLSKASGPAVTAFLLGAKTFSGFVIERNQSLCLPDTRKLSHLIPDHAPTGSVMAAPLRQAGAVAGCLTLCSPHPHAFELRQLPLLEQYADLLAPALPPQEFFELSRLALATLPELSRQEPLLLTAPQRISHLRQASSVSLAQAEYLVWQQIEAELIEDSA